MKTLFDATSLGGMTLKNRVLRSATVESAENGEGHFAATLGPIYTALAKGGVGAIITGMVGIDENSRVSTAMLRAYGEHYVPELRKVADMVHALECTLVVQLSHCGRKATCLDGGGLPLGPSEVTGEKTRNQTGPGRRNFPVIFTHARKTKTQAKRRL